jgi:alanine racemase
MDQCAVDVTAVPDAAEGDDVLLLGAGPEGEIPVLELAKKAGTNRNEILAAIGRRVPRLYFEKGRLVGVLDYLLGEDTMCSSAGSYRPSCSSVCPR